MALESRALLGDLGVCVGVRFFLDAQAAIGIALRSGVFKKKDNYIFK